MALDKESTDRLPAGPLQEAEEILRRELVVAQMAYASAGPEDKPVARRNYLKALGRFADLVMDNRIPSDLRIGRSPGAPP